MAQAQLKRLIHNFLWSSSDGSRDTRARVTLQMVILLEAEGSMGIINLELQSQALLGKLIIHSLTPGEQT